VYYLAPTGIIETFKVVAAEDETNVDIYCDGIKESHNINEAKSVEKSYQNAYCAVHANKPVLVAQMGGIVQTESTVTGNPMMATILGANQYTNKLDSCTLNSEDSTTEYHHYFNIIVLTEYYQPDMIHLTQGGETHTLNNGEWRPIVVDNVVEAYAHQHSIKSGPYSISHDNSAAKMTVVSFGTGHEFGGYGHSAQFRITQGMLLPYVCCNIWKKIHNIINVDK